MIAAVIDTAALLKMFYVSLIAAVSVAVVFSLAVFGVTRASDMRRARRAGAAAAYAALAGLSLALSSAIVVYGLMVVISK